MSAKQSISIQDIGAPKTGALFYLVGALCWVSIIAFAGPAHAQKLTYPESRTVNVVDFYHGEKVADPYRWLEEINSDEVKAWAKGQNDLTRAYLDTIPYREKIKERLIELNSVPHNSLPVRRANRYFSLAKTPGENQYKYCMMESLQADPIVLIDPNAMDSIGTTAITQTKVSWDGKLVAYALSYGGSDWQEIHIMDIDSRRGFDEVLKWCKFVDISWAPDNSGFFYDRWPEQGQTPADNQYDRQMLYWHRLGTPQSSDSLVMEVEFEDVSGLGHYVTQDGRYFMVNRYRKSGGCDILYLDFEKKAEFKTFIKKADSYYYYINNRGTKFYFHTGFKAPGGRIVAIDMKSPNKINWQKLIEGENYVIDFATMVNDRLVVACEKIACHELRVFNLNGRELDKIELPTFGTISGLSGLDEDSLLFVDFESFLYPKISYIYSFRDKSFVPFKWNDLEYDFSPYVTSQIIYESAGDIGVPMFIVYKKDIPADGNNPTLLFGYGGFGISEMPHFSSEILLWLENGGVYAVANIRGGGEFGQNWHSAGVQFNKENSFDDFIGAAKWLIDKKITGSSKLAIMGGSNGGLLVAVCVEREPNLFGAVVCGVPVTDMLRYRQFAFGDRYDYEYGDPADNKRMFDYLYSYSPYHNVSIFSQYPPILITTGENDDRVPPLHAYKFTAALQAADDGTKPKLLRVEEDAGHGVGKPFSKRIEGQTDIMTFLFKIFGMTPGEHVASDQ